MIFMVCRKLSPELLLAPSFRFISVVLHFCFLTLFFSGTGVTSDQASHCLYKPQKWLLSELSKHDAHGKCCSNSSDIFTLVLLLLLKYPHYLFWLYLNANILFSVSNGTIKSALTYLAYSRKVLFFDWYLSVRTKVDVYHKRFQIKWCILLWGFLRSYQGRIVRSDRTKQNVFNHSRIVDQASGTQIASFPIYKVLFCARGHEGSDESDCFCFTESYRSSEDFQIHVFSCHIKEAVSSVIFHVQRVSLEM